PAPHWEGVWMCDPPRRSRWLGADRRVRIFCRSPRHRHRKRGSHPGRAPMSRCRSREWHRAHRGRPCRRHLPLARATPTAWPNPADRVLLRLPTCPSWTLGARRLLLAVAVAGPAHQCPVLGIEVHGSFGGSGAPFCSNSIDCLSGERTNAITPSRGGRLIVTPAFISFSQVA